MSLNITKGEWVVIEGDRSIYVSSDCGPIVYESDKTIPNVRGDLTLIAEAGTVANECGLTPRQLLKQRNDLLANLEEAVFDMVQMTRCINGLISSLGGDEDYNEYSEEIERYKSVISKIKGVSK